MMHREELLNAIIDAVRRQDSRALAARAAESHPSDMAEALATQKIQAVAPLLAALDADTLTAQTLTDAARNFIADEAYDPVYGARPLKRYVQHYVETPLARELVGGQIRDGQAVTLDVRDDALTFTAA